MNSNYIGTLKEKLDKFHGIVTPPRYATSNSGAGFECELSLSLTRLDLSPRAFTVRSTGVTSSKKAAEQSAAYVMLSTPSFVNFYNGNFAALAEEHARVPQAAPQVTQAPQAPNNSTHSLVSVPEPPSTATTLLASVSASQIAAVVNTNENFKGQLLEQIAKHAPHYEANFESSQPAPFLSTVTVQVLGGGGGERLVAAGMAATTKKQAEQSAAAAMLSSAAFQSLCSTSRVSTRQLVAALFQTTTEHMMELSSPVWDAPAAITPPIAPSPLTVNAKGRLLERVAQMNPQRSAEFRTTDAAPFVCTVTITPGEISVTGASCPNKKLAEWHAAFDMLQNEFFLGPVSVPPLVHSQALSIASSVTPSVASGVVAHPIIASSTSAVASAICSGAIGGPAADAPLGDAADGSGGPPHILTPLPAATPIATPSLSRSTSFASSQPSSSGTAPDSVNYKGRLQEKLATMLGRPQATYLSTTNAPFVSSVTILVQNETPISVMGDQRPTKKAAEQSAAERMLQHPFVSRDGDRSADCLADQTVKCSRCQKQIGIIGDFMFFDKTDTEVQFALKPEVVFLLAGISAEADPNQATTARALPCVTIRDEVQDPTEPSIKAKCTVICAHCGDKLGVQMATGPDGTSLTSFGSNKVVVKGRSFTSQAWQSVSVDSAFDDIDHRTEATFFGTQDAQPRTTRQSFNHLPVVYPTLISGSYIDSADYQYTDLLSSHCKKGIRTEQLQAFHKCLQQNMAVVFPTGFGKTFVASLVMHRFRVLNPKKLAVMIVDRIPLVDQQSKAIHHDTGLLVCPLSSENSTRYIIGELLSGKYDALVVTAGALHNYLHDGAVRVSDFSVFVFDECHHVVGEHMYTRILDLIGQCPTRLQPRVVGLTASPFSAKSSDSAEIKLRKMLLALHDADIYCPKILNVTTQEIVRHPVNLTPAQLRLEQQLTAELRPLVDRLCAHFKAVGEVETMVGNKPFRVSLSPINRYDWMRATNLSAEAHFSEAGDEIRRTAAATREVLRALKDNYLMGPHFVRRHHHTSAGAAGASILTGAGASVQQNVNPSAAVLSAQMAELCEILSSCGTSACILVFVDERHTAKQVQLYLSARFPHLGCERLIGQGGFDGMRWKGTAGQGAILQTFRSGDTKLIVCTSVLEEGLDVKVCDRVIRLGGSPTLIQVIQSKGRARDKAGRLDLICTVEEEVHFDALLAEESLLDSVLRCRPHNRDGDQEPAYIAEFMQMCAVRGKTSDADDDISDTDSLTSVDSEFSDVGPSRALNEEDTPSTENSDQREQDEPRARNYGLQMLLCTDHTDLEDMVKNTLQAQALFIDFITKLHVVPRGASSVVSDPRMFRMSDSLALVAVSSQLDNFMPTFCSSWDFRVNSAPVYLLAHPSRSLKPAEVTSVPMLESLSGVAGVTCGHFVSRQSFLQIGELGGEGRVQYSNVHVERGKRNTLVIEGAVVGGRTVNQVIICIPATILCKSITVCADRAEKTMAVYFTLTSTPSMYLMPGIATCSAGRSESGGTIVDSLRSDCRVFCSNNAGATGEDDLHLVASCPVIGVTFKLKKWRRVMKLFTDSTALGLSVLITRVARGQYTSDRTSITLSLCNSVSSAEQAQLSEQSDADRRQSPLEKECEWTYATLVSDVYCSALNPVVLLKIKEIIAPALESKSDVRMQTVTTAMQQLQLHLKQSFYWEDALGYFTCALQVLEAAAMRHTETPPSPTPTPTPDTAEVQEYVMIPRLLATPSRLVVMSAVHTKSNRLIRMLGAKYRLVYVKFRDEQGQGLFSEKIYSARYKEMFTTSINIGGKQHYFLLSSASQLREQTAVFFDGTPADVDVIRSSLIPDKSQFGGDVAKYISRLGLFCTADSDTLQVLSAANTVTEDDTFTSTDTPRILTDGAGRISVGFARKIFQRFFVSNGYYPSCVQVRAIGCKGILVVDPEPVSTHPGIDVVFRRSMRKFDTECHTSLCIVKVAEFNPVTLNREVINLLCALRDHGVLGAKKWSPNNTLIALQDEELSRLGQMLVDPVCAIDTLSAHYPRKVLLSLVQAGTNILAEPHFMSLLHLQYYHASRALRRKTHIPIQHGTLAMGAPDPTGVLRDGEISIIIHRPVHRYACCFDEKNEYCIGGTKLIRISPTKADDDNWGAGFETFVVTGPVVVYRNPCLDPGDLRVVTAVYRPELLHWKNVVLLPASAKCKRSLSAECSGGDLDGDCFGIIWDPRLVPPRELGFEAVDYEQLARKAKEQRGSDGSAGAHGQDERSNIADFVTRTMCNANLGRIANLHLAVCDQLTGKGAGHPLARQLAEAQSLAVDYPKTGIPPVIPSEARKLVRHTGYPHFMENERKPSYPSFQSLGTLYNITSSVACTVAFARTDREFHADASFAVPSWESHRAAAEASYELYEREVRGIMLRFGLESDAELVMGVPGKWSDEFESDHAAAAESLTASWTAVRDRFRRTFFSQLLDDSPDTKLQKACAWYHTAYSDRQRLHSFAWIVFEELALVAQRSAAAVTEIEAHCLVAGNSWAVHDAVSLSVGQSALGCWEKLRPQLIQALSIKEQQFAKIKAAILSAPAMQALQIATSSSTADVHLYGSAALLLCDYQSDIDICVNIVTNGVTSMPADTVLKDLVRPGVSSVAETCHFILASIPLVKITVADSYMSIPVDISAQNSDGVHKSGLIRYLYSINPCYLLLFSSVTQWARCCGLLRGFATEKRHALLNSGQMQALIVYFIMLHVSSVVVPDAIDLENTHTNAAILSGVKNSPDYTLGLGKLLLSFFMTYTQWGAGTIRVDPGQQESEEPQGRAFSFPWPVPGLPVHTIVASSMQEVSDCCRRALHCLAVSRNWSYLLEYCIEFEKARTSLELELTASLSKVIGPARAFHEMWLQFRSKATTVSIVPSPVDPARLVVRATGRCQQIQVLRQELLTLIYTGRLHSYGAIRSMASAYFMEGSSFLYAAGADSKAVMLQARPIYVDRYLLRHAHSMKELSTLSMSCASKCSSDVWKVSFKTEIKAKVTEQLSHLSKVKSNEQVIFSVHLGKMLLLDASRTFELSRGALSAIDMEAAMDSARNMKISTYGVEVKTDGEVGRDTKPAVKADGKSSNKGSGTGSGGTSSKTSPPSSKLKSNLASTFVSAIPIFERTGKDLALPMGAPAEKTLTAYSEYMDNIAMVTNKLESLLGSLGYQEHRVADPQAAIKIPGTTLVLPPAGWRVAVELSERQQLHVDMDAQGHVAAVSDRFLSWVSGTLVTPADVDLGIAPACENAEGESASSTLAYNFKDHDLRFKIGTVKAIADGGTTSALYQLACPGGSAPIELSVMEQCADGNSDGNGQHANQLGYSSGVDSNLSSEFLRSVQQAAQSFTCIRPSPLLKRPDMVSFARHVVQRRAFLLSSTAKVQVMAVMAVGNYYEGASLCVVNPFVDISLEVDATGLLSCLGGVVSDVDAADTEAGTAAGVNAAVDEAESTMVADPLALGDHLDNICDEILRVSDRIREIW